MDASTLKTGNTRLGVPTQIPTQKSGKTQAQTTQGTQKSKGTRLHPGNKNKTNLKTTDTSDREGQIVKEGNTIVTPKRLITDQMVELAKQFQKYEHDKIEKEKKARDAQSQRNNIDNMESSIRSPQQSAEKNSSSDPNLSSSVQDKTMQQSEISNTESEEDKNKQEVKKTKKVLTEQEKEEQMAIALEESPVQFLLHIPSSLVQQQHDNEKNQKAIERNKNYDVHKKDIQGSDLYTPRQAQTFNYAAKIKEQQVMRIERNDCGVYASVWDLYDAAQQDQLSELEILQELIKKQIDKDLQYNLKNPFCNLPIDINAIDLHSRAEVPGHLQYLAEKLQKGGIRSGVTTLAHKTVDASRDDSNKETSGIADVSGSKLRQPTQQIDTKTILSKTYGTKDNQNQQQLIRQHQQAMEVLQDEELDMWKEKMEVAKLNPTEEYRSIMTRSKLETDLKYVDRILNQCTYHKQYILYRNYPEVKIEKVEDQQQTKRTYGNLRKKVEQTHDEEEKDQVKTETLQHLFDFNCDITRGRTVSCSDFNPNNKDLLAVSYGELDLNVNQKGLIAFWTLKNPSYPERIIRYPTRVTCCKFSNSNPYLLAAGTYDGVVAIYDIRRKGDQPVQENKENAGKHNDCVWELHWMSKGGKQADKGESLVSVSSDGRIVEWSMKKGLEYNDLMYLKRQAHPSNKEQNESANFRYSAGFSVDFLKGESSMYLAATEEGTVHKCSRSYSEQYLDSYYGHTGPVYKVRCNPFWTDIFLTCSADWSCRLWNVQQEYEIKKPFLSLDMFNEVLDVEWSPNCSTLFASVGKDGRVELWDLSKNNMLDPYAKLPKEGVTWPSKTMVRFNDTNPILCTGDTDGDVSVFRVNGYEDCVVDEQYNKLEKLLYPTGFKGNKEKQDSTLTI